MKPNELRIGNLVLVDGEITIVKGWMIHLIQIEKTSNKKIEPNSITEEWLIRFGFDLDKHSGLYYKSGFDLEVVENGVDFYLGEYGSVFLYVQHVHQLQNLYFALMGEELKLKE